MITTNNPYEINFTSLKPQKLLGEKVLREFHNEMGFVKSNTKIGLVRMKLENSGILNRYGNFSKKLREKEQKLRNEIYDSFIAKDIFNERFQNIEVFEEKLVKNIKGKGNKANCWEDMMIVFAKLLKKGQNPYNFEIRIHAQLNDFANHFTTVFGLKEGADLTNPKTWGTKAVIVDAWANIAEPAITALEKIKTTLLAGRKLNCIEYFSKQTPKFLGPN